MKKLMLTIFLLLTSMVFGVFEEGEMCYNVSWVDNENTSTSIYDLTENKAILIYWGVDG